MTTQRRNILIGVLVALIISSAILYYRGFKSQPLSIVQTAVSSNDIIIKSQVDAVKIKITKALNKIDTGGALDSLTQSQQFQELVLDAIRELPIGDYGRGNPFIPPEQTMPPEASATESPSAETVLP